MHTSLTIRYAPSHTSRPILPSSPTATSQTTSPARIKCDTPAFFSSSSHATTLSSDNQSPSGEGTKTWSSGARLSRKSGDCAARTGSWIVAVYDGEIEGARLDPRDVPRCSDGARRDGGELGACDAATGADDGSVLRS